jgi:hypothetical protein
VESDEEGSGEHRSGTRLWLSLVVAMASTAVTALVVGFVVYGFVV